MKIVLAVAPQALAAAAPTNPLTCFGHPLTGGANIIVVVCLAQSAEDSGET